MKLSKTSWTNNDPFWNVIIYKEKDHYIYIGFEINIDFYFTKKLASVQKMQWYMEF
jgi:hypothetical protein